MEQKYDSAKSVKNKVDEKEEEQQQTWNICKSHFKGRETADWAE